jgi:hypothetical protein
MIRSNDYIWIIVFIAGLIFPPVFILACPFLIWDGIKEFQAWRDQKK